MKSKIKSVFFICSLVFGFGLFPSVASAGHSQHITCESIDKNYQFCPFPVRGGAYLVKRLSDRSCSLGHSWGFTPRGIWVAKGCRGIFAAQNASVPAYVGRGVAKWPQYGAFTWPNGSNYHWNNPPREHDKDDFRQHENRWNKNHGYIPRDADNDYRPHPPSAYPPLPWHNRAYYTSPR